MEFETLMWPLVVSTNQTYYLWLDRIRHLGKVVSKQVPIPSIHQMSGIRQAESIVLGIINFDNGRRIGPASNNNIGPGTINDRILEVKDDPAAVGKNHGTTVLLRPSYEQFRYIGTCY